MKARQTGELALTSAEESLLNKATVLTSQSTHCYFIHGQQKTWALLGDGNTDFHLLKATGQILSACSGHTALFGRCKTLMLLTAGRSGTFSSGIQVSCGWENRKMEIPRIRAGSWSVITCKHLQRSPTEWEWGRFIQQEAVPDKDILHHSLPSKLCIFLMWDKTETQGESSGRNKKNPQPASTSAPAISFESGKVDTEESQHLLFYCLTFPAKYCSPPLSSPSPFAPWLLLIKPVQFPLPSAP